MPRIAQHRAAFALRDFKAYDDTPGLFSGYLAVFSNEDLGGDVIEPGAFAKTLNDARERKAAQNSAYLFPILYQHDDKQPCGGFVDAHEDGHGLYVKGQLDLDTQLGRDTYSGLKKGYMSGLSIGYSAIKHKWVGDVRHLQELALYEGSVVTFPMNPAAQVATVKADDAPDDDNTPSVSTPEPAVTEPTTRKALDFNAAFTQLSAADALQDEWGDSFQALVSSLYGVMQLGNQPGDSGAQDMADTVLEQFTAHMSDLVARSLQAQFTPCLDDDGDSFYDPDGPNASEEPEGGYGDDEMGMSGYGMMSAGGLADEVKAFREGKAGRTLSADNHLMMTKALDMIGEGHKALSAFVSANDPKNAGDEPPQQSDSVYDPGFGKSQRRTPSIYHYANARAGARPARPHATTQKRAGASDGRTPQATTHSGRDNASTESDDVARFRALMADIRQHQHTAAPVAG